MKNNFITKIIGATLAFAMMIGGAVGINAAKQAKEVNAATVTYKLTIDANDFNTTSYAANNNEKTSTAVCTTDNTKTFEVDWTSNQVMKNGSDMQWQKSNGYIYNSTNLGTITNVTVTSSAGSFTKYYGTSEHPTSGTTVGNGFFTIKTGSSATGKTSRVEITFNIDAGAQKANVSLSCDDLNLDVSDPATALVVAATSNDEPVNGLTYTYSVANPNVATVSNAGEVMPVGIGRTQLTINFAGNNDYNAASKTINVVVSDRTQTVSDLTFTAACGGEGTADDGAKWTVTSDGTESTYDSTSGIHYGTGSASVTYLQLATTDIKGDIKQVVVNARDAQATAAITVSVGGTAFTCSGLSTATNTSTEYTFTGNARGEIVVRVDRGSSMEKAIYVKSVVVTFTKINLSSIALSGNYQTTFNQGDAFNHDGMVVTATYDDDSNENVTSLAKWTGYDMANTGEQIVTVTYLSKTAQYTINANAKYNRPTSLTVNMGGVPYDGYSYNSSTGAFSIEHVTGDVTIAGECPKAHGYWPEDPLTVAEARNLIDAQTTISGVYATGIVSEIVTAFDPQYGNISYNISTNGSTTSDQLQAFRGKNLNNVAFTSADDVKVGATVVIFGNLKKHNSTYEFDSGNYLVSYEDPTTESIINAYKSTASSFTSIIGTENRSSSIEAESIVFANLGLSNDTQYADPFDGGHFTITFGGGGNDGKYYNTGTGIRTYGDGTITIHSQETITGITMTWSGNYKPENGDVVDVGTYDASTGVWTGSENTIVFTRPTGNGNWRLQSVTVSYGAFESVSDIKLRFGASIPTEKWDAINNLEDCEITDYGVMLYKTKAQYAESAPTVQERYAANHSYVAIFNKGSGVAPTAEDGKYTFTARIDYTDETEYSKFIIAQAFIVVNGTDYYFLGEEMRESVRTLAGKANVETNLSSDALTYLTIAGN